MSKAPAKPQPAEAERRTGVDRRRVEGKPPGKHERRRGIESRKPEVSEVEMSHSEWAALSDDIVLPKPVKRSA
ncbi:MAG TPA: hypothetical protein VIP10_10525 [Burkholderiaceae bacterium]